MLRRTGAVFALTCMAVVPAGAQVDQVVTAPPNLVLSNYNSVPVGPFGGLEGSAYGARVGDPSAAWFNPAGLARHDSPQISGSAGVYQRISVSPDALPNRGGSLQQLPNYVGFTFTPSPRLTVGAAAITLNAWSQQTDAESILALAEGQQRFAYSSDSDFQRRVLALGVGYHRDGPWRVGGGMAISIMDLRLAQGASERIFNLNSFQSLLVTARTSASAMQLRSQAGVQYDTRSWRLGAAVRTPGATFRRSGAVLLDALLDDGPQSIGASVFDSEAASEYHLPWEFQGGAAWARGRVEAEFDVQAYSSIAAYSLVSSDRPTIVYADPGGNQSPSVTSRPFGGLTSASDGVVDLSAGGHVRLFKDRDLRVHGGLASNRSAVDGADDLFTKVDLVTFTIGVSGSLGKFQFAAGFNRQSGRAPEVTFRNLLNGRTVTSPVDVRLAGFIYSLAYQF